jgi:hypothetical protein
MMLAQQARIDVEAALAAARLFHHDGDQAAGDRVARELTLGAVAAMSEQVDHQKFLLPWLTYVA